MLAAQNGYTDTAIVLLKAKANINAKNNVRVGLAGWMVVSVQRLSTFGLSVLEPRWLEMSRECCCSVSHADVIAPITTTQHGCDAIGCAKGQRHESIESELEKVVSECDSE